VLPGLVGVEGEAAHPLVVLVHHNVAGGVSHLDIDPDALALVGVRTVWVLALRTVLASDHRLIGDLLNKALDLRCETRGKRPGGGDASAPSECGVSRRRLINTTSRCARTTEETHNLFPLRRLPQTRCFEQRRPGAAREGVSLKVRVSVGRGTTAH